MVATPPDTLDLQAAADALGVHYQTAYRWVRTAKLPARLVDGKYRVARHDIDALDAARRRPSRPAKPTTRRVEGSAERMYAALVAGDERSALELARTLVNEGGSVADLIQGVLVPPLRRIGQEWHDGQLSIWVEHRASAITERILGDLAPNPRGRRRGTAMVAAVSGDRHSLATTMAAVTLREDHWHVHHLGADVPVDDLVAFCADHDIDVAVITLTNPDVATRAEDVRRRLEAAGTPVLVGGPGRTLDELVDDARR